MMKNLLVIFFTLFYSGSILGQVALAPTALFLDKNGVGTLYVTNNSSTPQEITVGFQFGYTTENTDGNLFIRFDDSLRMQQYGLENIKAFPKTFILPPNQQQLVRIQVRMPKDKADATYFSRIKVGSSAQVSDVGESGNSEGVNTRVSVRFEQVIALFFKYGKTTTGIILDNLESKVDKGNMLLTMHYRTAGNSPYLGRVKIALRNVKGEVVYEQATASAFYFNGKRKMAYALPDDLPKGKYTLELTFETVRNDVAAMDLVKAEPYTFKRNIDL